MGLLAGLASGLTVVGTPVVAQEEAPEEREVEVSVELEGLEGELAANVRAGVALLVREGDALSPSRARTLFDRAPDEIRAALEPFGRYAPVIQSELVDQGDEWTARFRVDPGPATIVTRVDFSLTGPGALDSGFVALADGFPVAEGDTLHHQPYSEAKSRFSRYATNKGFFDADFDTAQIRVDREAATAEVVFHFETGPRYRFGPIVIEQDVLERDYVDGYVVAREGELFDADLLRASQRALTTGPWFGRADLRVDRDGAGDLAVPVTFELTPSRPQAYEAGLGYGTDTGVRGSLRANFRRLNRKAHNAEAEIRLSQIETSIAGRYRIPRPFPSDGVWSLFGSYGDVSPDWSTTTVGTVGASYSSSRGPLRETFTLQWETSDYEAAGVPGEATLVVAQADWSWTRADDRILPTRGHRAALTLAGAHDAVLSSTTFGGILLEGKIIRSLGSRVRVIGRAQAGQIFTDDLAALPPTRRFVTGGDQSVRGFGYQTLGPMAGDTALVGGRSLAVASFETDVQVIPGWLVAGFADAGNAADDFPGLEVEYTAGVGVRWVSPIGLLRLDLAFPLSNPDRTLRLHLVIGPDL
ncbi:MAG: autotransporter assembly complex protein TamA [Gemmatimonadota bacterium]